MKFLFRFNQLSMLISLTLLSAFATANDSPLSLGIINDYSYVNSGAVGQHKSANRILFDVGYQYQSELIDFNLSAQLQRGDNGSDLIGDIQAFSNIDEDDFSKFYQVFANIHLTNQLDLMVGQIDANGIFAFSDNASPFINSSMGFSPTITAFPTYPNPVLSVNLVKNHNAGHYVGAGVYAGDETGSFSDKFYITEAGYALDNAMLKVGYWHHDGQWQVHQQLTEQQGTGGLYAIADYNLPQHKLAGYVQFGQAVSEVTEIKRHVGIGLVHDQKLGFGISKVWLGQHRPAGESETAFELFYHWQINQWLGIKPDIQFIRHPDGNTQAGNALVSTVRFTIAL